MINIITASRSYRVTVRFVAGCYGSFHQSVIFDFGSKPVLRRELTVDVAPTDILETLEQLRDDLSSDVWTRYNCTMVPYHGPGDYLSKEYEQLMRDYPVPESDTDIITKDLLSKRKLTQANYINVMHQFLYLEEKTQSKIVSR